VLWFVGMKWLIASLLVVASASPARADAFDFKDVDGFKACLELNHLIVTVRTADGAQTRFLEQSEIQPRCVDAATHLLIGAKRADVVMPFVTAAKRLTAWENALDLVDLVTRVSPASCDGTEVYEVVAHVLERPDGSTGDRYVTRAKSIATQCLSDNAFRKDFVDELVSHEGHLAEHACDVLVAANLNKSCKRSKS
jgi:hypothetical protein